VVKNSSTKYRYCNRVLPTNHHRARLPFGKASTNRHSAQLAAKIITRMRTTFKRMSKPSRSRRSLHSMGLMTCCLGLERVLPPRLYPGKSILRVSRAEPHGSTTSRPVQMKNTIPACLCQHSFQPTDIMETCYARPSLHPHLFYASKPSWHVIVVRTQAVH
jgi:hypothetical protein